jgi:hypothetical protein
MVDCHAISLIATLDRTQELTLIFFYCFETKQQQQQKKTEKFGAM